MGRYRNALERVKKKIFGSRIEETAPLKTLVIGRVSIIDYRMPLKRPYGTARGVTRGSKNFLIQTFGECSEEEIVGVGEAQPRHRLTGDINVDVAWEFLQVIAASLPGRSLGIETREQALESVRKIMTDLARLARDHSQEGNRAKPFRGTLLGVEVALLDMISRSMRLSLSELLGQVREEIAVTVSTLSTQNSEDEFRRRIERQKKYPMVRVKGNGQFADDASLLRLAHDANKSLGLSKPIWMDLNEGLTEDDAIEFIRHIAIEIKNNRLPEVITLEQPIPGENGSRLPHLQAIADQHNKEYGVGEIRIMPDESLWDASDLDVVHVAGGTRAMNIKTAKAGGLLASLDLARKAVEIRPDTKICIGGMVGTSDITTWSLISLAKAVPRLDYITAVPPGNVERRISTPLTKFKAPGSNVHRGSDQHGIGAKLDQVALEQYIHKQEWFPREEQQAERGIATPTSGAHHEDGSTMKLDSVLNSSRSADTALQLALGRHMNPKKWKGAQGERLAETQRVLNQVNPFQVSYMTLRRIERRGLSVGRGLSFRTKMVEASESRNLGVHRPTWLLDNKAAAYKFVDSLGVKRPKSDDQIYHFCDLPKQYPCVVKSTRSTGSRGCYLVYSQESIIHVYDSKKLSSWAEMSQHAATLMDPEGPGHTLRDNWIIEEMILDPGTRDRPARDIKFFSFYGEILLVLEMRRESGREYSFTLPDNTPADTGRDLRFFEGDGVAADELELASSISREIPYPFVRIDMLRGERGLLFGEFTPRIGYFTDFNDEWDRKMGEAWSRAESRILDDFLRGKKFNAFLDSTGMLRERGDR